MNTCKKLFAGAIAVVSILAFNPTTSYAILGIGGTDGLGSFTGTIEYLSSDANNATLEVFLTNTSPVANGGYITGVALDDPGSFISNISSFSSSSINFQLIGGASFDDSVNVAPFGAADFGSAIGTSWLGTGGSPSQGIGVGGTESFLFGLTGSGLDGLSDSSFENLIVRFRGFNDRGSAKVPSGCEGDCEPVVPEPATMFLLGSGLLGSALARRKRQ